MLLTGIEEDLIHLLEDDNEIIREGVLHVLAKAGGAIREKLGDSSRFIFGALCFGACSLLQYAETLCLQLTGH